MGEPTSSECAEAMTLRRAEAILGIAHEFESGVVPGDLLDLLPDGALRDLSKVRLLLERSGTPVSWAGGRLFAGVNPPTILQQDHRSRQAQENWDSVQREVPRVLEGVLPVLRSLSVTGSLAFGESSKGDRGIAQTWSVHFSGPCEREVSVLWCVNAPCSARRFYF